MKSIAGSSFVEDARGAVFRDHGKHPVPVLNKGEVDGVPQLYAPGDLGNLEHMMRAKELHGKGYTLAKAADVLKVLRATNAADVKAGRAKSFPLADEAKAAAPKPAPVPPVPPTPPVNNVPPTPGNGSTTP